MSSTCWPLLYWRKIWNLSHLLLLLLLRLVHFLLGRPGFVANSARMIGQSVKASGSRFDCSRKPARRTTGCSACLAVCPLGWLTKPVKSFKINTQLQADEEGGVCLLLIEFRLFSPAVSSRLAENRRPLGWALKGRRCS